MMHLKRKKGSDFAYRGMMFVAAVSLVILAVAGFWGFRLMNRQIQISKNDAMIANLAGEQRLILSNFSFMFHTISKNDNFVLHESVREHIIEFLDTLRINHDLFIHGDAKKGIFVQHSEEMKQKLFHAPLSYDDQFREYLDDARLVFDTSRESQSADLIRFAQELSDRSSGLVRAADDIIIQYQDDSRNRLNLIIIQLSVIGVVYLGALAFGTILAVIPMRRRILNQMRDLGEYAEDLEEQKQELEEVREVIMSILQDNQLEKAAAEAAEKKTAEYAHQLEYSNTELQDFAHVASHDLKEPLRKILVFGDMLKSEAALTLPDKQKDYVDRMQDAARRMQHLIEGLLDYSSVSQAAPQLEWVDLNNVLFEVISDLEMKIKETRAIIDCGELPEVLADKLRMRQLFQNLISNAIKYQPKDNIPRVTIRYRAADNDMVEISIADNGIGFDPKQTERIFKPFERLHSRSAFEGSGIGLAICRKIVMSHRGRIEVESEPGRGSVFYVRLRSKNQKPK